MGGNAGLLNKRVKCRGRGRHKGTLCNKLSGETAGLEE